MRIVIHMMEWIRGIDRDALVRRLALTGVIISTAIISYAILKQRAEHIGITTWVHWLYPIGLDALILGASRAWTDPRNSTRTRRFAAFVTIGTIIVAIGAFVTEFAPRPGEAQLPGWLNVAFACVIPASLACVLIITTWAADDRRAEPTQDDEPRIQGAYEPVTVSFAKMPKTETIEDVVTYDSAADGLDAAERFVREQTGKPYVPNFGEFTTRVTEKKTIDDKKEWIEQELRAGRDVTGADADKKFPHLSRNGARDVRAIKMKLEKETV